MIINNIVYSEKFHIVALFKDYLISDNLSEFLKRSITKILYTSLPEAKFIYKYIHKKQKMIDFNKLWKNHKKLK